MWKRFIAAGEKFLYAFPIRLVIHHFKRSPVMMAIWAVFFLVVTGNFGTGMGIPYLFLDPEYLNETSFLSFALVGFMTAGYIMVFHITSYINDGYRFSFLGTLKRPFARFTLNNSIIPVVFVVTYVWNIVAFQITYEINTGLTILKKLAGFFTGFTLMTVGLMQYFRLTNQDAFKILSRRIEKRIKKNTITRATVLNRLAKVRGQQVRVDSYLDLNFKSKPAYPAPEYLKKKVVTQVFNQNHLNAVIVELGAIALVFILGWFGQLPILQLPAAASAILTASVLLMILGAIAFWSRGYTTIVVIVIFLLINYSHHQQWIGKGFEGLGLDYTEEPEPYSVESLAVHNSPQHYKEDMQHTLGILETWRAKFPVDEKPKMVFICTSGGGQRSALWTMTALQAAQMATQDQLMDHTMLITGASGGLVGASYYRELYLRSQLLGEGVMDPQNPIFLDQISNDNLNPVIFSLLVNDLFFRNQTIDYGGQKHPKDRGVAFEEALNRNTGGILDKPISAYREHEEASTIPMLFVAPSIVNDGRRMYISPQPVSYMAMALQDSLHPVINEKDKGIDFVRFFQQQNADSLRFLSALRMGATFPYITPNISLPSTPAIQIMDSGISDNFGVTDAVRFVLVFQEWINANTSGVVFLSIRDSEKEEPLEEEGSRSLSDKIISPVKYIYRNWSSIQDLHNDDQIEMAQAFMEVPVDRVDLQFIPRALFFDVTTREFTTDPSEREVQQLERASLNWRLTTREKNSIRENIKIMHNQEQLSRLVELLEK
ncbi:MAG TPA: phospholipase [Cytophagales bacterium]|nr:phospholipase [Cytophagales bacterium]HAA22748.1 phospholipase [Cytophagales bacterium]HAP63840.1 phospholipase [Cytophagales bacterium]